MVAATGVATRLVTLEVTRALSELTKDLTREICFEASALGIHLVAGGFAFAPAVLPQSKQ